MIIYLLFIIPIASIAFLLIKYRQQLTWWEVAIQLGVATILIISSKLITEKINITDTEYWGSSVLQAEYYEAWNEWIVQTCTREVPCGSDSKGNTLYTTETYDCSYCLEHPAHWQVIVSDCSKKGREVSISEELYHRIVNKFGNQQFQDLGRHYYTRDGDAYFTTWDYSFKRHHFIATEHLYDNKVQVAKSVFNFPSVSEDEIKQFGLFEYPKINDDHDLPTILGPRVKYINWAERKFKYLNGTLGPKKQIRVWVLLFDNQPRQAGLMQEALWKRGNKNELVICIGLDKSHKRQWSYVFSWTEKEAIIVNTRNFIDNQKYLDLAALSDFLYKEINRNWVRKNFNDFNYLTIEPPLWAVIIASLVQLIFNILFGRWIIKNRYE